MTMHFVKIIGTHICSIFYKCHKLFFYFNQSITCHNSIITKLPFLTSYIVDHFINRLFIIIHCKGHTYTWVRIHKYNHLSSNNDEFVQYFITKYQLFK